MNQLCFSSFWIKRYIERTRGVWNIAKMKSEALLCYKNIENLYIENYFQAESIFTVKKAKFFVTAYFHCQIASFMEFNQNVKIRSMANL